MNDTKFLNTAITAHHDNLPEGWTPWNGRTAPPADYINGPVFTRDGSTIMPGYRISPKQWTWEDYEAPFGSMPDDIIGYMPGYVKAYDGDGVAPDDWTDGLTLFYDNTIMDAGVKKTSIAWRKYPPGATRASIRAYVSTDNPSGEQTKKPWTVDKYPDNCVSATATFTHGKMEITGTIIFVLARTNWAKDEDGFVSVEYSPELIAAMDVARQKQIV